MWEKAIIHSYIHNCYAQIEEVMFPILKEKVMVVYEDEKVLSVNDFAKDYGIQIGDSITKAKEKYKDLIMIEARRDRYTYYLEEVKNICREYSDKVESFEDEMWIDMTASQGVFGGHIADIAKEIQERIYHETKICVVMGVSFNKLFAKLANSSQSKMGFVVIPRRYFKRDIYPLLLKETSYLNKQMIELFNKNDIYTVGGIAYHSLDEIKDILGEQGEYLWELVHGTNMDEDLCSIYDNNIHLMGETMYSFKEYSTYEQFSKELRYMADDLAYRLKDHEIKGKTISLCLYDSHMNCYKSTRQLSIETSYAKTIRNVADMLLREYCLNSWNGVFKKHYQSMTLIIEDIQYEEDTNMIAYQPHEKSSYAFSSLKDRFRFHKLRRSLG